MNGPDQYNLQVNIIDWTQFDPNDQLVQFVGNFQIIEGESSANYVAECQSQGFEVAGSATVQFLNILGVDYLRLSDVSTDVTVTDVSLYPGNVDELTMDIYLDW